MGGSALTERDREEACSVTTHGSGHQFEIQLGHLCNNRCVFCSSGQLTQLKLARPIPLAPILEAIEKARAAGARRITFLGGEPTLHKGFVEALRHAVELGFEEIVIFTNGVMLPHPGFVDRICALGRFEWRISIQGGNEEAHVAVTGRKDSFRRIVEGLRLLRERGQDVTTNLCVNERSYRSLPDYPALIREYGIRQLHVDVVRPESTGERSEAYLREIMPRYSAMAPYLDRMLEELERTMPGFDVNIGNLPYCVLPKWAHVIHHGGDRTVAQSCDESSLEVAVDKYEWHGSLRRHVAACARCVLKDRCTGVFTKYLELHGDGEFRPIGREELLSLDPKRRHFVLYAEQWLAPLHAAIARGTAPRGFAWAGLAREPRAGWVEASLTARDVTVTLRFSPVPEGGCAPEDAVLASDRYAATMRLEGRASARALAALLETLRALLARAPGVAFVRAVGEAELAGLAARAALRARGAARVAALAAAIERRASFGAFRCAARKPREDGLVIDLAGPDGASIAVILGFSIEGGRLRPSVDFALGEGTSEALAEPAVLALIDFLRGPAGQGARRGPDRENGATVAPR
ncbi:MAG TPA: radical SAM protein [Sandaracinaceae bacterium]